MKRTVAIPIAGVASREESIARIITLLCCVLICFVAFAAISAPNMVADNSNSPSFTRRGLSAIASRIRSLRPSPLGSSMVIGTARTVNVNEMDLREIEKNQTRAKPDFDELSTVQSQPERSIISERNVSERNSPNKQLANMNSSQSHGPVPLTPSGALGSASPVRYLYVSCAIEGITSLRAGIVEWLYMAKSINATFVEPCVKHAQITACFDHPFNSTCGQALPSSMPFSAYFNVTHLKANVYERIIPFSQFFAEFKAMDHGNRSVIFFQKRPPSAWFEQAKLRLLATTGDPIFPFATEAYPPQASLVRKNTKNTDQKSL